MKIYLTDNNRGQTGTQTYCRKDVAAMFPLAGKTVEEVCKENENLLVFPYCLDDTDDRIGKSTIIDIQNTGDPDNVVLTTGNIMGFIGTGNLRIKIKSRFDKGRGDFLLHYMLQKVMSFNLFNLNHNNEQDDVFDFTMFLFPHLLKNALQQGVYKEYQCQKRNDANLKGTINIGRHINNNIPFNGKIAYSTREHSHDNSMTQLVRHTIEFMKTQKHGHAVLDMDYDTIGNVKTIVGHTPTYNKNERSSIINKNLRQKVHPYYMRYLPLRSLCLQILRAEEMKYGEYDDEISGILFDGAWLWEEYVGTLLRPRGFLHPENKKKKDGIYLFEDKSGIRFPDFYKEGIVLDAKYKRLGSYDNVAMGGRNDIHQIISYMACLGSNMGGFVSPLEHRQQHIPTKRVKGLAATLSIFGIEISKEAISYATFCKEMEELENVFLKPFYSSL